MPTIAKNEDRQLETGAQSNPPSTVYAQPWWRGFGNTAISSSMENTNGSVIPGAIQSHADGDGVMKETRIASGLNGNNGQDQQHHKHVASSTPTIMGEHPQTNSQMELVGHSIVLTSCPYSDPQYGGIMTYGAHVYPHLLGIQQTRMPLPHEMEDEPVYVNAKQYHGILRRRQSRAKAEMEKKAIKARKPYLHESRHQHAMRRARGSGGRFLNTKKVDSNVSNPTSGKEPTSGVTVSTQSANSSGSEHLLANYGGNSDRQGKKVPIVQDLHIQAFSNGNSNGHALSSMYQSQLTHREEGSYFSKERRNMMVNQASHGVARVK